jgi:PAS domain S-box-containing protein/putative nucleotidyltransferase with HDIG domain
MFVNPSVPPETEAINLLIVDDKPANLMAMEAVLESPEYHIYTALSGAEALRCLLERDFALVLLDIQMPGMDGFECARLIKQSDRTRHIPIIFVTAIFKEEKYIFSGYSLGAVDYICKPVDATILKAKVTAFVDLYRQNQALKGLSEELHLKAQIPDLAADSILVFDTAGQPVYANAAAYLSRGYSRDEFMHLSLNQLVDPQLSGLLAQQIQTLREAGELRFLTSHFRKDGAVIPVEVYSCLFVLDGKELTLSIARDITERLKAEGALLQAHAALEERVKERTADLARANLDLEEEVALRRRAESELEASLEQVSRTLNTTVEVLGMAVEMRDPYTAGHQQGVGQLATEIAREMGLSPHQLEGLRLAAMIHDLGKITIPTEILSKPGKLSDSEMNLIRCHSQAGYDILNKVEFPWPVANMVVQHHERLDGSGYPLGLKGPDILLEARILMVADVVEAMLGHRPYRPALGLEKALAEISQNQGILYDPTVVDACLRLFNEKGFKL